jgi:regulator of sirC expression with transglutaminase-like and TPR domain
MRILLLILASVQCFAATTSALSALYSTLDPTSVAQHFAFYELYPKTPEGRNALKHAWDLLSGGASGNDPELILPTLDVQPILSLVNRSSKEDAPLLNHDQLTVIGKLSQHLGNRNLKGFGLWDLGAILTLPSSEVDLGRALLIAELGVDENAKQKIQSYEASLDLMSLQITARLKPNATPLEKVRAINDYIFSEMRFRFPPHSLHAKEIDVYTFLPSVLDGRRGVCLGVSILYLCLAQRLELSLQAITPPGHIYVRYVDPEGNITNIETTARGIDVPTEHYLGVETKTLQERTIRECVGLAFMNQAAVSWHRNDSATAVALYEKAGQFLSSDDYLLNLFLGFNYLSMGKEKEGRALLKKVQGQAPEHVLVADTMAEDYLAGRVDIEGIQAVFAEVNENRSSILEKQKRLEATLAKYPRFRQGYFHMAITWMQLGREREALPFLEKCAAIDPENPTVNYYLAAIHFQRHNFNQAWKYLRSAEAIVKQKKHDPKALVELRRALQRQCPEKL